MWLVAIVNLDGGARRVYNGRPPRVYTSPANPFYLPFHFHLSYLYIYMRAHTRFEAPHAFSGDSPPPRFSLATHFRCYVVRRGRKKGGERAKWGGRKKLSLESAFGGSIRSNFDPKNFSFQRRVYNLSLSLFLSLSDNKRSDARRACARETPLAPSVEQR